MRQSPGFSLVGLGWRLGICKLPTNSVPLIGDKEVTVESSLPSLLPGAGEMDDGQGRVNIMRRIREDRTSQGALS